ncbi:hypothetical protein BaRGS_00018967, partial [Batillaria attramentaria]
PKQRATPASTPLVGTSNIVDINVNGHHTSALLDTGSMVSTISASLVAQLELPIQRVTDLITVRGIGGQSLPYVGYVQADVKLTETSDCVVPTLLLVVKDTEYHSNVPVLLGTNFLQVVWNELHGDIPSSDSKLSSAWRLALTAVTEHQTLRDAAQPLGQVLCDKAVTVPPGACVEVTGSAKITAVGLQASVVVDGDSISVPGGLVLLPLVLRAQPGVKTLETKTKLFNPTCKPVTVPAHTAIASVQLADVIIPESDVTDTTADGEPTENFVEDLVSRVSPDVQEAEKHRLRQILEKHEQAVSKHDLDLGHTERLDLVLQKLEDADALSRIDWGSANTTPAPVVAALLQGKCCSPPLAETVYLGQLVTEQDIDGSATSNQPDWKAEQRADPELLEVINHLQNPTSKVTSKAGLSLLRSDLSLQDDVLYRRRHVDDGEVQQLVLPAARRTEAMRGVHDQVGHLGFDRSVELLRDRFFWPGMSNSLLQYIQS